VVDVSLTSNQQFALNSLALSPSSHGSLNASDEAVSPGREVMAQPSTLQHL